MENQIKPYDKYILYVYAFSTIFSFLPSIFFVLNMMEVANLISIINAFIAIAGLIFYIYAVFADTKQINAIYKKAPSKWWLIIMPVYLWKRANILKQPKTIFWGFIGVFLASILMSIIVSLIMTAALLNDPSFLEQLNNS